MRENIIIIAVVFATALFTVSCTKTSYKSYTCTCTEVENSAAGATTDYGIESENRLEAGNYCNDIENRVNNHNEEKGSAGKVSCKLK